MATRSFIAIYKLGSLVVGAKTYSGCCEPTCKTIQTIEFPKFTDIETGSKVALELSSSDLVVQTCDNGIKTIEGLVTSATQAIDAWGCKIAQFALTISYDDAQLVDPTTVLVYNADSIGSGNVLTITPLSPADQWFQKILECADIITLPINLATDVTGVLPVLNGGTGQTSLQGWLLKQSYNPLASGVITESGFVYVDMAGTVQSVVVNAGDKVRLEAVVTVSNSSLAAFTEFVIARDGVPVGPVGGVYESMKADASATGRYATVTVVWDEAPAAGTYNYSVQWRLGGGSAGSAYSSSRILNIQRFGNTF